jgi:CRISPR/Cas system-associated exonuclease Cas4 (RecB family)
MHIEHLSVSRSGCFEQCQQQYKFKYHLKVIPDRPEQIYFTYGKIVHAAAEFFVEQKGQKKIRDIVSEIMTGELDFEGSDKIFTLDDDYRRKLYEHTAFIEKFTEKVGYDGDIEYEVRYDLDPPKNKIFLGFIDRLIIKNDQAIILDYKTSKDNSWRKNKKTIKTDLQLCAYALYVHEHFNIEPEKIQAALVYLENPTVVSTNFTKKILAETKQTLKKTYSTIESIDADKVIGNVGYHCKRCDFNDKCAFYRAKWGNKDGI